MVAFNDLFAEVGMTLARADAIEEVSGECVKRFGLLGVLQRIVEIQTLETGLHLNFGDGESPHGQTREEEIPVLSRDEVGGRGWRAEGEAWSARSANTGRDIASHQYCHLSASTGAPREA